MAVGGFRRALHWVNLLVALLLGVGCWAVLVLVSSEPGFKWLWDVSPQAIGTVSPLTDNLLEQVRTEEKIAEFHLVRFGLMDGVTAEQKHLASLRQSAQQQTWDLLQQYANRGGAAVQVRSYMPGFNDDKLRELTERYPVPGYGVVVVVLRDPATDATRHHVVSIEHELTDIDSGERIAGMAPGARALPTIRAYLGEQVLSSKLQELLVTGRPKVYFLEGYASGSSKLLQDTTGAGYAALAQLLSKDGIEVDMLSLQPGDTVPGDAAAVALMEPHLPVLPDVADVLERFVRKGGRLLINYSWSSIPDRNIRPDNLGARFGYSIEQGLVCRPVPDPYDPAGRVGLPAVAQHDFYENNLSNVHPLTRPFALDRRVISMFAAREITQRRDVREGVRPDASLIVSDPSWLEFARGDGAPDWIPPAGGPGLSFARRSLGMVIDVDPPAGDAKTEDSATADDSGVRPATGHVVVLGGRALNGRILPRNRDFALGLFNWLTRRDILVAVRAKEVRVNLMAVSEPQLDRVHTLVVMAVPGSLLLLCLIVFWRRSR